MKIKVSISIDEETSNKIDNYLDSGIFRNRSHFIEHATKRLLEEAQKWK